MDTIRYNPYWLGTWKQIRKKLRKMEKQYQKLNRTSGKKLRKRLNRK